MALHLSFAELAQQPPAEAPPANTPFLLTMAGYGGTLAAARCLGRAGIPVTIAQDHAVQPTAWSRWTTRRVRCPDFRDSQRLIDRLLELGSRAPRHVLYPTCDDLAFLFARHANELAKHYLLYQPPLETLLTLLDKRLLGAAATAAGLHTPVTYVPRDEVALARIAREARFPLVIKPCTQVMFRTQNKGICVYRPDDLLETYRAYARANTYLPTLLEERPDVVRPMLQEYLPDAEENVHSVAGFVDREGKLFAARASRKVLQQPRHLGVGVCFEEAPLDPADAEGIATLCKTTGYFGVFEAEFIHVGERRLLIDFNPRFYNQMGFDIARGLPLPLFVHAGARRDERGLERAVLAAQRGTDRGPTAWCHRFALGMMVLPQRMSGRMTASDTRRWRRWLASHGGRTVDATFDRADMLPALMDAGMYLKHALRHPRGFFRTIVLNR